SDEELKSMFESWIVQHERSYSTSDEKEKRFGVFKNNLKYIDEHNALTNQLYKLGLNRFADLTNEEYRTSFLGFRKDGLR
ncbi:cysteine proteinase, partial [Genlisea aurea]